jgi:hypothetical protein
VGRTLLSAAFGRSQMKVCSKQSHTTYLLFSFSMKRFLPDRHYLYRQLILFVATLRPVTDMA